MATFIKLTEYKDPEEKLNQFFEKENKYVTSDRIFIPLEGNPYNAYWLGEKMLSSFNNDKMKSYANCCTGMQTGGNDKYIRIWYEVNVNNTAIVNKDSDFQKYNCGGENRRWYGNHFNVVYWKNDGENIRNEKSSVIRNKKFFYKEGISWKRICGEMFYLRFLPEGFIFDQAGDSMFPIDRNTTYYLLGFLNSKVAVIALKFIAPTLNLTAGNMKKVPVIIDDEYKVYIDNLVLENINIAHEEWDEFEISWDFKKHPLI